MRRLSRWIVAVAFVLIAVAAILAVVDNRGRVALYFLDWSTPELSIYWWLLSAFTVGVVVGWLGAGVQVVRARVGQRQARRELQRARAQTPRDAASPAASTPVASDVI